MGIRRARNLRQIIITVPTSLYRTGIGSVEGLADTLGEQSIGATIRAHDGRYAGRMVSPLTIRPDGIAEGLALVDLTDTELVDAFPHGYVIDPDFETTGP